MAFANDDASVDDFAELQRKAEAMQSVRELQARVGEEIGPTSLKIIAGSVIGIYLIYRLLIK